MCLPAYPARARTEQLWFVLPLATALVLIAPVWLVTNQSSMDGPSHLAELYVLTNSQNPVTRSPFYEVQWSATPDLAAELVVPVLNQIFPFTVSVKLFLSLAILFWAVGPGLVQSALYGRQYATSLAAGLLAYNANFFNGFWNCYFGLGLALVIFSLWIRWSSHFSLWRRVALALAFLATYACHLVAAVGPLILLIGYETHRFRRVAGMLRTLAVAIGNLSLTILPALIAALFRPSGAGLGATRDFFLNFGGRVHALLQVGLPQGEKLFIPLLLILFGLAWFAGYIRVHASMRRLIFVFALICVVVPVWAGGGWGLHIRYPALLGAVALASCAVVAEERTQLAAAAASLACVAIASLALLFVWKRIDAQTDEYRTALRQIPVAAKTMLVVDDRTGPSARAYPYFHIGAYAVIDRNAFFAGLLTTRGQHVVYPRSEFRTISARASDDSLPVSYTQLRALEKAAPSSKVSRTGHPNLRNWPCTFDVVTVIGAEPTTALPELRLMHRGSFFSIYAVHRPSDCGLTADDP